MMALSALNEGRDVNPGDTDNGLPGVDRWRPTLNEGRDVNPGDTPGAESRSTKTAPLNEGRDVNPGDTRSRAPSR